MIIIEFYLRMLSAWVSSFCSKLLFTIVFSVLDLYTQEKDFWLGNEEEKSTSQIFKINSPSI